HVHGSVRLQVAASRGGHFAGPAEIAFFEVVQGDGGVNQALVELPVRPQRVPPEVFEFVMAGEELPLIEQADAFDKTAITLASHTDGGRGEETHGSRVSGQASRSASQIDDARQSRGLSVLPGRPIGPCHFSVYSPILRRPRARSP